MTLAQLVDPSLTPSLGAVLMSLSVLIYSEARLRRARATIKEARARAIDAQRAAGATRRAGDPSAADELEDDAHDESEQAFRLGGGEHRK